MQVLFLWYFPANYTALHPSLHEVRVSEAPHVHPLPHGHEAVEPRAHGEHHVVQRPVHQDELQLQCLPATRETKTVETETESTNGEENN